MPQLVEQVRQTHYFLFHLQLAKRETLFSLSVRGGNKDLVRFKNFPKGLEVKQASEAGLEAKLTMQTKTCAT